MKLFDLVQQDTKTAFKLASNGGKRGVEYQGPCPFCKKGTDRFHVWTDHPGKRDNFWCRVCERAGDDVTYCRELYGDRYGEACDRLGGRMFFENRPDMDTVPAPRVCEPPAAKWQAAGLAWLERCEVALWDTSKPNALRWLARRGLRSQTIIEARLGANPQTTWVDGDAWGLDPSLRIWFPRGIVLPWFVNGRLWKMNIRRPTADLRTDDDPKYVTVRGSSNALYGIDTVTPRMPAVLSEGVFDALAIRQEAGDLVGSGATGTTGARETRWLLRLNQASIILLSHDNDGIEKGEAAAKYWLDLFGDRALRWRPYLKDAAEMLEKGVSVRAWIEQGLECCNEVAA